MTATAKRVFWHRSDLASGTLIQESLVHLSADDLREADTCRILSAPLLLCLSVSPQPHVHAFSSCSWPAEGFPSIRQMTMHSSRCLNWILLEDDLG